MACRYIKDASAQAKCEGFKPDSLWRCKHIRLDSCPLENCNKCISSKPCTTTCYDTYICQGCGHIGEDCTCSEAQSGKWRALSKFRLKGLVLEIGGEVVSDV